MLHALILEVYDSRSTPYDSKNGHHTRVHAVPPQPLQRVAQVSISARCSLAVSQQVYGATLRFVALDLTAGLQLRVETQPTAQAAQYTLTRTHTQKTYIQRQHLNTMK